MRINSRIILRRLVSFILIVIILFSCLGNIQVVSADDDWIKIVGGVNGSQNTKTKGDTIIQTGTHNSADDNVIRYKTLYFRMTKQKYDLSTKFDEGSNASIKFEYVPFEFGDEIDNGTTKIVEYIIQKKDFLNAAATPNIGITGDYLVKNGSATVYLNNVFEVLQGAKPCINWFMAIKI